MHVRNVLPASLAVLLTAGCGRIDSLVDRLGYPAAAEPSGGTVTATLSNPSAGIDASPFQATGTVSAKATSRMVVLFAIADAEPRRHRSVGLLLNGPRPIAGQTYTLDPRATPGSTIGSRLVYTDGRDDTVDAWVAQSGTVTVTGVSGGILTFTASNVPMIPAVGTPSTKGTFTLSVTGSASVTGL